MKQKDIATIIMIIGFSVIISVFVSNLLITSPENRQQRVEIVEKIGSDFTRPDERIFNKNAINPTQTVEIGNGTNTIPFSN